MHIPDGLIAPEVAIAGYGLTGFLTWYSLRQINQKTDPNEGIPKASLLTAAFFVVSLIHIPVPPTSIHLVMNGLMGIVLGYYAFPAILIGLFLQAVMFGHGGLSTLGINAVIMGSPALLAYYFVTMGQKIGLKSLFWQRILNFLAGAGALLISAVIFVSITITNIAADVDANLERQAIYATLPAYGLQVPIEGVFTVMVVSFLEKVKPELLTRVRL